MVLLVDYIFPLSFLQLKLKCHQIPHRPFGFLDFKSSFISFHCKIPNQLEITTYLEWVFNSAKGQATYRELPASKNPWLAWQFDGMSIFRVSISGIPIEFDLSQQSKFGFRYQSHQWHLQTFIPSQGLLIWHKDDCILWYLSNFLKLQAHKTTLWLLGFKDAVLLTVYVFFMLTNFKEIQSQ